MSELSKNLMRMVAGTVFAGVAHVAIAVDLSATSNELAKLYKEDQADRDSSSGQVLDWEAIGIRDERRELRVKQLLAAGPLGDGTAYYHAAMVLQHASTPDDYLLAHDLCVIAISKGENKAKWLAAASLDRFLLAIGRPQRFGTQYQSKRAFLPPQLATVDPNVPDMLRSELDVPTLEEARKTEAQMISSFNEARKARK
ncbi:hypothetical protein FHW83_003185 [Duganella sp. SG902]|uniref:hypothetical protein n=1 Tax=Duganella sp. SG902 TaxID=2587016 RepID=UPI00159E5A4C|nr:hypothetical protein [Duganella sp. SG902]NVM77379.1 hypothetical protein [Duganella sp. SG902]